MVNKRQIRLLAISAFAIILVFVLYTSSHSQSINSFDNDILNSKNKDTDDEAINQQIGKMNNPEPEPVDDKIDETTIEEELEFDPVKELIEIRSIAPMVVFSKTYCPYSKQLKKLLTENYEITPEISIVELDKHKYGKILQEHLGKISGRKTVPNVLIGTSNESKGGCDDFQNLHESGKLASLLNEWGNKKLSVKKLETPSNL